MLKPYKFEMSSAVGTGLVGAIYETVKKFLSEAHEYYCEQAEAIEVENRELKVQLCPVDLRTTNDIIQKGKRILREALDEIHDLGLDVTLQREGFCPEVTIDNTGVFLRKEPA